MFVLMILVIVAALAYEGSCAPVLARGSDIQCQHRCLQFIDNLHNATEDYGDIESWKCNNESLSLESNTTMTCDECFLANNITRDDCTNFCSGEISTCDESCQCFFHTKEVNTLTPTAHSLELLCRDDKGDGATLVLQVVPPLVTSLFSVEVKSRGSDIWTQALVTNSSIFELNKLENEQDYYVRVTDATISDTQLNPIEGGLFTTLSKNYTPTSVRELKIDKYRIWPKTKELVMNVTWNPADDKICCHKVTKFVLFSIPKETIQCEPGVSWTNKFKTKPGQRLALSVMAVTSNNFESEKVKIDNYKVPQCPEFADDAVLSNTQLFNNCLPPNVEQICSREIEVPETSSSRKLYDLIVTWRITKPPAIAPKVSGFRIIINPHSDAGNFSYHVPVTDANTLQYKHTLPGMDVGLGVGYDVIICTENEQGKLSEKSVLMRRKTDLHSSNFQTEQGQSDDECLQSLPLFPTVTTSQHHVAQDMDPSVSASPQASISAATMASGVASLIIVVAAVAAIIARRYSTWRRVKRHDLTRYLQEHEEIAKFAELKKDVEYEPLPQEPKVIEEHKVDIEDLVNVSEDHLKFNKLRLGTVLGEGAFGVVRRAQMRRSQSSTWQTVAVKMLKEGASEEDKRQLQREVSLMKAVGSHPHIVCMLACSGPSEPPPAPYLVVEHCALGDLQNYLRRHWRRLSVQLQLEQPRISDETQLFINRAYEIQQEQCGKSIEAKECDDDHILTPAELLSIARQVAMGMEYLSSNRVVHRDLAARNVLVTSDRSVKIADFGLSRDVYEQNVYRKTNEGRMPIKWMALESLLHHMYTSASDVWSYGILLWEIVTLGGTPYPGIATSRVFSLLRSGYRMERPENCSEQLYEVMLSCWMVKPVDRPSFSQLRKKIEDMLEICGSAGPYLPLHDYATNTSTSSDAELSQTETEEADSYLQPAVVPTMSSS